MVTHQKNNLSNTIVGDLYPGALLFDIPNKMIVMVISTYDCVQKNHRWITFLQTDEFLIDEYKWSVSIKLDSFIKI